MILLLSALNEEATVSTVGRRYSLAPSQLARKLSRVNHTTITITITECDALLRSLLIPLRKYKRRLRKRARLSTPSEDKGLNSSGVINVSFSVESNDNSVSGSLQFNGDLHLRLHNDVKRCPYYLRAFPSAPVRPPSPALRHFLDFHVNADGFLTFLALSPVCHCYPYLCNSHENPGFASQLCLSLRLFLVSRPV
ncbi:hypothetical protein J6590_002080 [Homalodisca vitripennis]|nr:hypothetical protein J6590_002080 [Homalodisca vitripennis]